ncbi:MAG: uncharacterized protein QOH65_2234 [Methylobacteriaceae bacterium]|nr:uncharacterized protein [Methylobacteriaceae bacterium]
MTIRPIKGRASLDVSQRNMTVKGQPVKGPGPAAPAAADQGDLPPFWKKPLEALTGSEWEQLCDGCGRCCLVKLEDEDTGRIHYTDIACRLLDTGACRCRNYGRRREHVPDCVKLTPQTVRSIPWLPPTCAYRLRAEGRDLAWWHPLISGDPESVLRAGVSVRGRIGASEEEVKEKDMPDYIVSWPARHPKRAR